MKHTLARVSLSIIIDFYIIMKYHFARVALYIIIDVVRGLLDLLQYIILETRWSHLWGGR
jgi:hypothetical protein